LEYIPIDRKRDNVEADNLNSIRDICGFLKINGKIGIFGEGTTNKEPETKDFNEFDTSFIVLAKRCNSWVQPITNLWINKMGLKQKVIVNFGEAFKIENMSADEAMNRFMSIQKSALMENITIKNELISKKDKGV